MVVQQAMAAGLPVIATTVGGIPSQLQHGETGVLFEPGDAVQLAKFMKRIVDEPSWALKLGANARKRAHRRFRATNVANATIAVYQSVHNCFGRGSARMENGK